MRNVISYYIAYLSFIFCLNQHTDLIIGLKKKKKKKNWMFSSKLNRKDVYKNEKSILKKCLFYMSNSTYIDTSHSLSNFFTSKSHLVACIYIMNSLQKKIYIYIMNRNSDHKTCICTGTVGIFVNYMVEFCLYFMSYIYMNEYLVFDPAY
jgi:hypothetical protein